MAKEIGKRYWIDPPEGWRYGFPKIYPNDGKKNVYEWLVENGYPQEKIDYLGRLFFTRSWEVEDGEE
jgi:hypothetical protein